MRVPQRSKPTANEAWNNRLFTSFDRWDLGRIQLAGTEWPRAAGADLDCAGHLVDRGEQVRQVRHERRQSLARVVDVQKEEVRGEQPDQRSDERPVGVQHAAQAGLQARGRLLPRRAARRSQAGVRTITVGCNALTVRKDAISWEIERYSASSFRRPS